MKTLCRHTGHAEAALAAADAARVNNSSATQTHCRGRRKMCVPGVRFGLQMNGSECQRPTKIAVQTCVCMYVCAWVCVGGRCDCDRLAGQICIKSFRAEQVILYLVITGAAT